MRTKWSLLSLACAVTLVAGCGEKKDKSEALNPVKVDPEVEDGGVGTTNRAVPPSSMNASSMNVRGKKVPGVTPGSSNAPASSGNAIASSGNASASSGNAPGAKGATSPGANKPGAKGATNKPVAGSNVPELSSAAVVPADDEASATLGREHFAYSGGVRDPFASLLEGEGTGPELSDLLLVSILHDNKYPSRSVAVFRGKINNKMYRARPGDRLGRMRVSAIRIKDVTFAINDFGTIRLATLSLRKREEKNK